MKTATILAIGDEILAGNTVDTNSNFICAELKKVGIKVQQIFTIADDIHVIRHFLAQALESSDLVLTTGGLGPTKDDKTIKALAQFFDDHLVFSEKLYQKLSEYLKRRGREDILEHNRNQCEVLSKAVIFENHYGTAPCQMIERNGSFIFSLPGVPMEMKHLIKDQIIPFLTKQWGLHYILTQIVSVVGIPESLLSDTIESWELALPKNIKLSYLPMGSRIKLRLTATGENKKDLEQEIAGQIKTLKPLIEKYIIAYSGNDLQEILAEILKHKKLTISTAESCTTGHLAAALTSVSGSSSYFVGGVIPYKTALKTKVLHVKPETIKRHTVVSEEVAKEMALGCQKIFGTDIAVGTTGVSGPNKGDDGHDVGTIYFAIAKGQQIRAYHLFLPHYERKDFVDLATRRILEKLILWLEEDSTSDEKK